MKIYFLSLTLASLVLGADSTRAADFIGPGRFCGYSAIIDLREGEKIATTFGGIHSGGFFWSGDFGTLEVRNIGWTRKPKGFGRSDLTSTGQTLFRERRENRKFVVAIWNRRNGSAYFSSETKLSDEQMAAIDRVYLFDELSSEPKGCNYRTVFSWE